MNPQTWLQWLTYAALTSLAAGLLAVPVVWGTVRLARLERDASLRYTLRFIALLCVAAVLPVFLASAYRSELRAPLLHVPSAAAARVSVARVVEEAYHPPRPLPPVPLVRMSTMRGAPHVDVPAIAGVVWIAGFAVCLIRLLIGGAYVRRLKKRADVLEVRHTRRGEVAILASDACVMPMAVGYIHPAIVIPSAMAAEGDADLENIALHELEHLRRFDDIASLVQALCTSALWFNPFVYILARDLAIEREMACDEAVISRTGKRTTYAKTLWKIALGASETHSAPLASAFISRSHAAARMTNVLDKRPRGAVSRLRFAAVALVVPALLLAGSVAIPSRVIAAPALQSFSTAHLLDGSTLVIGGRRADGSGAASAQLYDSHGRRTAVIPMRIARWAAQATRLQSGDVLVTGGMTSAGATSDVELYRTNAREFQALGPLRVARAYHSATLLANGDVLIAAGQRTGGALVAQSEIYDVRAGAARLTAEGEGRIRQAAFRIENGNVLMMGGSGSGCAFIYDVRTHGYRTAGTLLHIRGNTLTFRLPNGSVVTHEVR